MAVDSAFMETIPAQQIVDRMLGAIIGHALGDAVGLPNEYASAPVAWPSAESHRGFTPNDWSEKTDHMMLVMRTMLEHGAAPTPSWERTAFAAQLIKWSQTGLAECGDTAPVGVGGSIGAVMADPDFAADPTAAALNVWKRSQGAMCTNAHMSRSVPTGLIADRKIAAGLARSLAMTTHADPRAHTASAIYALVINGLVYTNDDAAVVLASACAEALGVAGDVSDIDTSAQLSAATQAGFTGTLSALDLNGNGSAGALRALSVMAYTLQILARAESAGTTPSFAKIVRAVADQRGSASVNAGIAGSIVGAALGCSRLPEDMLDALPHGSALAELVGRYVSAVKK